MLAADLHQRVVRVREDVVLSLGLCWDYVGAAPVDLDLSAVCFTRDGQFVDVVFFGHAFPCATDAAALRRALVVDPSQLPYMFLSGDSTIGGEEANCTRLCTCELCSNGCSRPDNGVCGASRASRVAWPSRRTGVCGACCSPATAAMDDNNDDSSDVDVFHRLYAEEELWDVQAALDRGELPATWTWQQQQQQGDDRYARDACDGQHTHTSSPPQPHRHRRQRRRRRALSDEVLTFVLHKVPAEAHVIFVCVTSYNGVALSTLPRVRLRLHNESDDVPVYTIDVARAMTGSCRNATGNLACMLVRAPPPATAATTITTTTMTTAGAACANAARCYWDVREMNVAAVAYTFVDVLPMMLTILGVPAHSRADALRRLPNYSLQKQHHSSSRRSRHQHDQQQALTTTTVACTLAASADADAAWCTADASLLSDVRFAVGWHGAYDVSAFAVMLDAHNRYVDHVHAAHGKMRGSGAVACRTATTAMYRTCAAGVGGGDVVLGDREYIDLVTYRVPSRVRTIVVGAVYTLRRSNHHNGSGGVAATDGSDSDGDCGDVYGIGGSACDDDDDDDDDAACGRDGDKRASAYSIYDVPSLYLRLQNRTLHNPYSNEIDRWRVDAARHATKTTATHKQKSRAMRGDDDDAAAAVQTTYMTLDGTVQPVRTLLHGALLRTRRTAASCTAAAALPDDNDHNVYGDDGEENGGRRDGMAALYADATTTAAACAQSLSPAAAAAAAAPFDYVPIHRAIPADARHGIDAVLPFLQFVAHCVWGHSHDDDDNNNDNDNDTAAGGGTWHVAVTAASPSVHEADAAAAAASTTTAAVAAGNDNDALSAPLTVQSLATRTMQQPPGVPSSSSSSLLQARVAETTAATGHVAVPPPSSYLDVAHNLPTWRHAPLYDSAAATVTADAAALAIAAAAANDVDNNNGNRSGGVRAYTRDDVTHARHHRHNDSSSSRATRTTASAIGRLWDVWMRQYAPVLSECVAVEVQLLDVCGLQPRLPDRFRCHVEAWVCARASALLDAHTPRTPATARAFRSPYLYNADDLRWDTHNRDAAALFLVHRYDRIRLVVYEHAAVAVGELDLLSLTHLWQSPSSQQPQQSTYNDNNNNDDAEACTGPHGARYNSAVHTVALSSGTAAFASGCCVRVRVSRVPVSVARKHLLPAVAHDNRRRAATAQQRRRWTSVQHNRTLQACNVM